MKPVQRIVNIYKAQSQLSQQNNSSSTFGSSGSLRGHEVARSAKDSNSSFDKILREQMIKTNLRLGN